MNDLAGMTILPNYQCAQNKWLKLQKCLDVVVGFLVLAVTVVVSLVFGWCWGFGDGLGCGGSMVLVLLVVSLLLLLMLLVVVFLAPPGALVFLVV